MIIWAYAAESAAVVAAVVVFSYVSRRLGREPGAAGTAAAPPEPGGAAVPAATPTEPFGYDNGVKYDGPPDGAS